MGKKVLVIGSGGREHSLAWKLSNSPQVSKVYIAPGNAGTALVGENVDIDFIDGKKLLEFAKSKKIDLTVIGQEAASEAGVADLFRKNNLLIFGSSKEATRIESSKAFSKDLMKDESIPTAEYKNFDKPEEAIRYIKSKSLPIVIKADGLAAGKGVVVAENHAEAEAAVRNIMVQKTFGRAGNKVVIEDFLEGQEVSTHALSDGHKAVMFPSSQDHKQIFDGDKGPNTGGMGVIAPVPWVNKESMELVRKKIVYPAINGLKNMGAEFVGCLYPGLMINRRDIRVVEFNSRFGDPEAEVYMRLLDSDLYQLLENCAKGKLDEADISWMDGYAVSVVLASAGYPETSSKGDVITGIEDAEKLNDIVVFHAGTKKQGSDLVTAGGRVLNVTATGKTLEEAVKKAYAGVELVKFDGMQYRTDIGHRQQPE
ncbi:MAG TPA: phosphoribosylamine--glycine ligase [Candidatus Saccharimonadales bacterium]|nr:phosphoribosylamine--glycine ligase [Candidatus Saccharimonadales bacterium]